MGKPIVYVDCDGTTYDTIPVAFEMMKAMGCNMNDQLEKNYYFREVLDWREIFRYAKPINNSTERIMELKESGLFEDVKALTALCGAKYEESCKYERYGIDLPGIEVITVSMYVPKSSVINPRNSILVDDSWRNCIDIIKHGGVGIRFVEGHCNLKQNIINDLGDIPETEGVKRLIRTRYF